MTTDSVEIETLYRQFGPLIYRRCRKLLCDHEAAEDATQEVFVRAMRHADRLMSDRQCLPWLYRVTTNYCLNVIRETAKVTELPLTKRNEPTTAPLGVEGRLDARKTVLGFLRRFDETNAQIALLAHLDRMTQDEIAAVMGLSRRTIGKRLKQIGAEADAFAKEQEKGWSC